VCVFLCESVCMYVVCVSVFLCFVRVFCERVCCECGVCVSVFVWCLCVRVY